MTAAREGSRRVLCAVDGAAHALGLRAGQPVALAKASVPGLLVHEARPDGDRAALEALAAWCLRYAPVVQADPPDGVFVNCEGAAHLFGGEAALLADATARLAAGGITALAALAETPGTAWALARHAPGSVAGASETAAALAGLPLSGLRLPPETCEALRLLGIERIGDLDRFSGAQLTLRFGPLVVRRRREALGLVPDPLTPLVPAELPQARASFAEPVGHLDGLAAAADGLVRQLCRTLERRGGGLRRLDAVFRRVDGRPLGLRIGTARPSRDPAHLVRLLGARLPEIDPGFGIDEIVVVAARCEALRERQGDAGSRLDPERPDGEDEAAALAPLVDRLGTRLGPGRIFRAAPVESRVPERSVRRLPPLSPRAGTSWPAGLPRPSRLIDPPEPVRAVAVVPDDPPTFFIWRRVRYVVHRADGPERVRGEWWRSDCETASLRDYYRVEDTAGRRFWLFRDAPMAAGGHWWMHGRFA